MPLACWVLSAFMLAAAVEPPLATAEAMFRNPPDETRPWVYWFVANGNLSREGITADFEAMKRAGLGGAIFMEVEASIPAGPVPVMSPLWVELIRHAIAETDRLGLEFSLSTGPGWTGAGGPWIKPEHAMQHLVGAETAVKGPAKFDAVLPQPQPRGPFFGGQTMTPELYKEWHEFYHDVAVLAFPTPQGNARIADVDEKAIYHRAPFSSQAGVKPYLPAPAEHPALPAEQCIPSSKIIDLTSKLAPAGRLTWEVPAGDWTIMRFGRTLTGQTTRPAPAAGLGFESGKFDKAAIDAHFAAYIEPLAGPASPGRKPQRGLTTLHFDSWELSAQNWSESFAAEFKLRRGYDPVRFVPAMNGRIVDSLEISERFLWDLRQTAQELVVENHLLRMKELGRRWGLSLSTEPYDLNPCADLTLGGAADVPMGEFWTWGGWFDTTYSCVEATSIGHTLGKPIIAAESFTAGAGEDWRQFPAVMKAHVDWALCAGINRITFHCFTHQPRLDQYPGMTMGPHGVHWDRTQTWWDLSTGFHRYVTRCQAVLRRGLPTADILYLNAEGAPRVFQAPNSALRGNPPDRLGYNFDGIAPEVLMQRVSVKDGCLVLPEGTSYRVLVLPEFDTMTPALLGKIKSLVEAGATLVGSPPRKSPGLSGFPQCDEEVKRLATDLWGDPSAGAYHKERDCGKGHVVRAPSGDAEAYENFRANARWIWGGDEDPAVAAAVGFRYFRTAFDIPAGRKVESASLAMTADNGFELWLNGKLALTGSDFHRVWYADVAASLVPGANLLAVAGNNVDASPNPAGLIGSLTIRFADGGTLCLNTDATWETTVAVRDDWKTQANQPAADPAKPWTRAKEFGMLGRAPWGLISRYIGNSGPYPSYEMVAGVLSTMGVPPDFESKHPLRYIHRRDGDADIYYVSSMHSAGTLDADCVFRVAGKQPELWDPLTGETRPAAAFSQQDGRTTIPLRFEPSGSVFVVFRQPALTEKADGRNFPTYEPVREVPGPWTVTFDPKWGGPAQPVVFEKLSDWAKHPEEGIRHYSGKAVYRTTFELPAHGNGGRMFLETGRIQGMAEVRVNGKPAGVVWCDPWRIEITGVLRGGRNDLELIVANLWPNRMIGDAALPQDKRFTWSTYQPFPKDQALLESGLLGPVRVMVEKPD